MKNRLFISSILYLTSTFSLFAHENNNELSSRELFNPTENQIILETIDKTCGDSWCEGDYDFQFNTFSCSSKTFVCELNFQFIKRDEESGVAAYSSAQFCHFKKIHEFGQIMESEHSLTTHFYESLSQCISKKETKVIF